MRLLNRANLLLVFVVIVAMTMLYGGVHQPVLALFYVLAALAVIVWAVESVMRRELRVSQHVLQLPLLFLGVYALIQVVPFGSFSDVWIDGIPRTISADPFATKLAAIQIFSLAIFFAAMLTYLGSAKRIKRVAAFVTIFGFAYAFFAVLQSVLSPDAIYGIYKRPIPFGSFVNRNDFAAMMVMLTSVPLGMLFGGVVARDKRLLYVVAVVLMG